MPTADRMASLLLVLMLVQSLLGLLQSDQYRDVEWIKVTWYGNDWITLVAAVPLLSLAILHTGRESVRGRLLVLGMAGYAVYNYAFYLFGAALNVFFPLYVVSFLLGILTLGRLLSHLDVTVVADSFEAAILGLCDRNDCRDSGRALPLGVVRQLGHRDPTRSCLRTGRAADLGTIDHLDHYRSGCAIQKRIGNFESVPTGCEHLGQRMWIRDLLRQPWLQKCVPRTRSGREARDRIVRRMCGPTGASNCTCKRA
jgi:hypothetical protein